MRWAVSYDLSFCHVRKIVTNFVLVCNAMCQHVNVCGQCYTLLAPSIFWEILIPCFRITRSLLRRLMRTAAKAQRQSRMGALPLASVTCRCRAHGCGSAISLQTGKAAWRERGSQASDHDGWLPGQLLASPSKQPLRLGFVRCHFPLAS